MHVVDGGCGRCANFIVLRNASAVTCATSTLDFVLRKLGGPIVLANSRLPVNILHASNGRGLLADVRVTASHRSGKRPVMPRIYVFFRGRLVHNGHAAGVGTRGFGTFHSFGCPMLTSTNVRVGCGGIRVRARNAPRRLRPRCLLSAGVTVLGLFPNVRRGIITTVLTAGKLGTMILRACNSNGTPQGR